MNKIEKINILMENRAAKLGCTPSDFKKSNNIFIKSKEKFMMLTFGNNIVMRGKENLINWCKDNFIDEVPEMIMDGENLFKIENRLRKDDKKLCGQHTCYLFMEEKDIKKPSEYEYKLFKREDLHTLYKYKQYDNALCFDDKIDALALGAFLNGECIALAAADDRNINIFQIGVDTKKEHRGRGLGAYLVSEMAKIIEDKGKIATYTTWGANIPSSNIAIKTGFLPVMTYYFC